MVWKRSVKLLISLLGIWIFLDLSAHLGAEILWFQEVGYQSVWLRQFLSQGGIWAGTAGITALYLFGNLWLAERLKHRRHSEETDPHTELRPFSSSSWKRLPSPLSLQSQPIGLALLLPLAVGLSCLVGLLLLHYGQVALTDWKLNFELVPLSTASPALFRLQSIGNFGKQFVSHPWYLGFLIGFVVILLLHAQFLFRAIAIALSAIFGFVLSHHWPQVLLAFSPTSFHQPEPVFGQDVSFYVFYLPVWELLEFWLIGLFLYGFVAVTLTYLLSGDSLSEGRFPGFSPQQQRHLFGLGGGIALAVALSYWLSRYELLYSPRGVTFGASYTDVTAQLPAYTLLSLFVLTIAIALLYKTVFWQSNLLKPEWVRYGLGTYLVLAIAGIGIPTAVQSLIVQPNELVRERPYIERAIAATRQAFDLEAIDAKTFNPTGGLKEADLKANELTIRNIRLWDQRPLLETNRQLQQIRSYYRFPDADVDRYILQPGLGGQRPAASPDSLTVPSNPVPIEKETAKAQRQVLIAARELDYAAVPQQAQTWVNQHLIYTHGYGFTLSPVNTVGPGGLPEYFVKDIGGSNSALSTANETVRASIPIGQPRIYFGEITDTYIMTGTRAKELDYPSGSDNAYNIYDGRGGITIDSFWRRWLFAIYLRDWKMLLSQDFLPETKVLFRRNIRQHIRTIAPFLQYDRDPYLVTANINSTSTSGNFPADQNYLYWMVDAYTTSDRYPYSDLGREGISYIRNAVKVVIDAYHGSVVFYVADPTDPMITSWSAIFPNVFKPLSAMPVNLRRHLRYPVDFFKLQSERLMTYHMTDPQVFYNREDQWQIPNEVYGSESRPVEPYYLITSLPSVPFEEFILLLPYTPRQRPNLIAWLAARSDGENYGKRLLYVFPKERLVYGPEQVEARINQDPVISQQISLWNRQGSRVIQGNLLIIPIEQSLLYVEPLYLEATQNSLPTLVRVIVAYENRIVMASTLEEGLQAIFKPEVTPTQTIIRPVEEATPPQR